VSDKAVGIIPARYASSRFPGKLLAPILGKSMLQWVLEAAQASPSLERVIVATDDSRISDEARRLGAEVQMTSPAHASGTDRVAEVAAALDAPLIINIQGDEPLFVPAMIDSLAEALQDDSVLMASLMVRTDERDQVLDRNIVKVVVDSQGNALYFSRFPIPFGSIDYFYKHIGIYGYKRHFLLSLKQMPVSRLETAEKLEQLRVLENGYKIRMVECEHGTLSVDTPEDIIKVEQLLKSRRR
jgi:3-deoxy-manno-octulosonate cytidylyltransferase (CMP-KDO synthetase)